MVRVELFSPTGQTIIKLCPAHKKAANFLRRAGKRGNLHGPALRVPVTEDEPRTHTASTARARRRSRHLLHRETLAGGVQSVVLHPGHISGPGWPVITPPATWIRVSGRPWRQVSRLRRRTMGWASCITCTPTTWRRRSSAR